jgi:hypothetical protein
MRQPTPKMTGYCKVTYTMTLKLDILIRILLANLFHSEVPTVDNPVDLIAEMIISRNAAFWHFPVLFPPASPADDLLSFQIQTLSSTTSYVPKSNQARLQNLMERAVVPAD